MSVFGWKCSTGDWKKEMQCYPYVIDVTGKRYMFYYGNGFGAQRVQHRRVAAIIRVVQK